MANFILITKVVWEFLVKYWPLVSAAFEQVDRFIKEHPGVSDGARERFNDWRDSFLAAQKKRSAEARVRATLDTVRRIAEEQAAASGDGATVVGGDWLERAASIERALELATAQTGRTRRRMLAQVAKRTDALVAEAFLSLLPEDERAEDETPGLPESGGEGPQESARETKGPR
ncbi:hypothetical protein GXB85_08455 [Cellulomonas sp. APG4]|uniref:hypothetical protein n=1 Tax=Cellulomonas sp. APG4 TaxID=1538656 RepID=UPI00137B73D7|nr:hypothetical protein [Cellulomonas sp. APG4]NCT90975.1 hypothetical protein [Cellulomonas sp. APG4]